MSYSLDVKSEICGNFETRSCCRKALLNSAFCFFNTVNENKIQFKTASYTTAFYILALTKETFGISFELLRKNDSFILSLKDPEKIKELAKKAGMINNETKMIQSSLNGSFSVNECCRRAAIRGAFLASGYISDPKKSYHFEITSHRQRLLNRINDLMLSLDIEPKIIKRGTKYVLYLKEKEQISDTLNILNATKMYFRFQEVTVEKEIINELNRKQNFEQANLDKTLNVSVKQCEAIRKIIDSKNFDSLDESLKEIALLRLDNPDASLNELASLTKDKISRSGVNHRLKKLMETIGKTN